MNKHQGQILEQKKEEMKKIPTKVKARDIRAIWAEIET